MKRSFLSSFSIIAVYLFLYVLSIYQIHKVEAYNCSHLDYSDDDLVLSEDSDSLLSKYATQYQIDSYAAEYGAEASLMQTLLETCYRSSDTYNAEYYFDLLSALNIYFCTDEGNRYIEISDDADNCAQINGTNAEPADYEGLEGQCEGPANCYWGEIVDESIARPRKYSDEDAEAAVQTFNAMWQNWAFPGGLCIALGVLWLLCIFIVAILRCFCGCCGGRSNKKGYTCCQRWFPLIFYFIFTLLVIASTVFAILGAIEINTGIIQTFESTENGLIRTERVIGRLHTPLNNAGGLISGAVNDTADVLDDTTFLLTGYEGIEKRVKKMRSLYGSTEGMTFLVSGINDTISTLEDEVGPVVDSMDEIVSGLSDSLVGASDVIVALVEMGVEMLESFNTTVISARESVTDASGFTSSPAYSLIGDGAILSLFLLSILLICCGYCGIASGYTTCKWDDLLMIGMHCTWVIGTVVVFLAFLIAGILLPTSLFWYDSCQVLDYSTSNFTRSVGGNVGPILDDAWNGSSLLVASNMSHQLEFTDAISSMFDNIEGGLNITSTFEDALEPLEDLDLKLAAYNASTIMENFNALTNAAGSCPYDNVYTFANITEPWVQAKANGWTDAVTTWGSNEDYARNGAESAANWFARIYDDSTCTNNWDIVTTYYVLANLTETVSDIRGDLGVSAAFCSDAQCPSTDFTYDTAIDAHILEYQGNITLLFEKIENLAINMVGELVDEVQSVKCIDGIDFLKESYNDFHYSLCETLLNGVLQTLISFIVLGIAMIGIVIITLVLHGRLKVDSKAVIAERELEEEAMDEEEEEDEDYNRRGSAYNQPQFKMTRVGGDGDIEMTGDRSDSEYA